MGGKVPKGSANVGKVDVKEGGDTLLPTGAQRLRQLLYESRHRGRIRQEPHRHGHIRGPLTPAVLDVAVTQVHQDAGDRFEQVVERLTPVPEEQQRIQQRKPRTRNHVVVGPRVACGRQQNRIADLIGRQPQIGGALEGNAQNGVENRQEVDRVLREVDEAIVFPVVDLGQVQIGRSGSGEPPLGALTSPNHHEVHLVAGHPLARELVLRHRLDDRTLGPAENHRGVLRERAVLAWSPPGWCR